MTEVLIKERKGRFRPRDKKTEFIAMTLQVQYELPDAGRS